MYNREGGEARQGDEGKHTRAVWIGFQRANRESDTVGVPAGLDRREDGSWCVGVLGQGGEEAGWGLPVERYTCHRAGAGAVRG